MRWVKRIGIVLLALLAIGFLYEFGASQIEKWKKPSPPGKLVDVGGYRMHIQSAGSGGPTVILEAGMGTPSLDWALVQPEIAKFTRVCSYDRAGLGWSDKSPFPRTSENIVSELHTLLTKAEIPKPYILVGHSMGGIHIRLYASRYPEEVAGLVLVDASHEEMIERLPPDPIMGDGTEKSLLTPLLVHFGIQRVILNLHKKFLQSFYKAFPSPIAETYFKMQTTPANLQIVMKENENVNASLAEMKKYSPSLGNKPLTVITAGTLTFFGDEIGYQKEWLEETYEGWKVLQKELAGLSSQGKQVVADKSDHLIPRHQPEIIIQAIREMVEKTR